MPFPKTTNLFMAGYRTTNLTFTGNPKTFTRAIPTTRHSPNSEEHQNHWKPNEACNRKDSLNPKRHETEQSRETPLPNTRITTKALHTLQTNNSNTITKGIAHLPLLHTRRRTITKTTRTPHRRTTAKRTKPHTPTERTTHPIHQQN